MTYLNEKERRFTEEIVNALPNGVIILDNQGKVIFSNQSANDIFSHDLKDEYWVNVISETISCKNDEGHEISLKNGNKINIATRPIDMSCGQLILVTDLSENRFVKVGKITNEPIASDPRSLELFKLAKKVAKTDVSVLITGESGTGKEVLAHYIHYHSSRSSENFIAINCAAIPDTMLESLLFGYEKGAFTGAYKTTPGKFELANNGTLLLDEITEMDISLQSKLLRVLQEKEVERVGGNKIIPLNVRIIATSNRDIKEAISENKFREDLYYRLNVFPLHGLPLRERVDDIIPISNYLLEKHSNLMHISTPLLSHAASEKLRAYSWPGNARELDNVIQRALVLHVNTCIEGEDIILDNLEQGSHNFSNEKKKHEYDIINQVLSEANGNRKIAAEKLAISERTLRYKLAEMKKIKF